VIVSVQLREEAERDIEEAANWYEQQREGLGYEFLDELSAAFDAVSERPDMYPVVHRGVHRALIGRFPFGVFYRVAGETAVVIAVLHARRSPRHWKRRT